METVKFFEKNCTNTLRKHNAIILCDCHEIIDSLNYGDVITITEQIYNFISKNIENNCCIGLLMSHNLYLPSIIISILRVQQAFIFLTKDNDICDILNNLGICRILSFDRNLNNFQMIDKIQLHQDDLYLYQWDNKMKFDYTNISYIISTSGSTGDKQYVRVTNDCIDDNIKSLNEKFQLTQDDIIYFGTPLTFDPSIVELLLALYNYSTLLIVKDHHKVNSTHLYKTLFPSVKQQQNSGVTFLQIVPSLFRRWSDEQIRCILNQSRLKILALGGEKFPEHILQMARSQNLKIFNLYGITEVSCWATICEIPVDQTTNPSIGEPLGDTIIEIRDDNNTKIHNGAGEIVIGSNKRRCFIGDETNLNGDRFRKTGDVGVIKSGEIFYLNRKNDQIKRYGHKVDLGKVEQLIEQITGLSNKCVWCDYRNKLINFSIIPEFNCEIRRKILDKLRVKLLHDLPRAYFPDFLEILPKFPLTNHGKIDTTVLELIYLNRQQLEFKFDPCDYFKLLLCEYFGLNLQQFDELLLKNFFDIGGNSIIVIQFVNEFAESFHLPNLDEFIQLLFDNNLNTCLEFIGNSLIKRKRNISDGSTQKQVKKIKTSDIALEIRWTFNLEACVDCTPIIFNYNNTKCVGVGSFSHIFVVLNCTTSAVLSKFILPNIIENSICSTSGSDILVGCYDGNLYCLDFITSTIKWQFPTGDIIKSKPVICCDNTKIVFCSYDKYIYCIKLTDGSCVWKTTIFEVVLATPICYKAHIYVVTTQGSCLCLLENSGDIKWQFKLNEHVFGSPCLCNDHLIIPGVLGTIYCLSLNGDELWQFKCGNNIFSSIIAHDDYLLWNCHDSNLYLIKFGLEIKPLDEIYRIFLDDNSSTTPTVCCVNNRNIVITLTNSGIINLIDFHNREVVNEYKLPAQVFSSPVYDPIDNSMYLGCRDNNLYRICLINK